MKQKQFPVMVGSDMDCPGGISSVVRSLRDCGFLDSWNVHYVSSYETPALSRQVVVMTAALTSLSSLFLCRRASLLHVHSASRGSFWRKSICCALARFMGVPYMVHIHSGEFPVFYGRECGAFAKWWVRHTLRQAARVVALTASWREAIHKIEPDARVDVIGNPVEVPPDQPRHLAARDVIFLGRLREKKGVFDLVRAIPAVAKRRPDVRFCIAGDGDAAEVMTLAEKLGVASVIDLPGWIDGAEKADALRKAAVLVLPSYFEGLPVCVLEAMAAGVAVVATRVGGIPDVIEEGQSGMLVEPGDVASLSKAILDLLTDARLNDRICSAAFARVKSIYSYEAISRDLDNCYVSIAGARKDL
jgi:glycosyltransferase involved in cell wall biosynthesis